MRNVDGLLNPYLAIALISGVALVVWWNWSTRNRTFDSQRPAPPRVPYWVPWIGSAIEMGKDPDAFFKRASFKHGPVFRVKAVGKEFSYVTSPDLISAIYRDSNAFEFTPIRLELTEKIFHISHAATYSTHMTEGYLPFHHRSLSPQNIGELLERYTRGASGWVQTAVNKLDGQSSLLIPFMVPPAYHAACYAFFGPAFRAEKSYESFRKFESQFHLFYAGVPKFMLPGPHRAWSQVEKMFEQYLESPHEDCSDLIAGIESGARDANWSVSDIARVLAIELFSLQVNAIFAAYWVLALELQKPRGLSALVAEVDGARRDWKTQSNQSNTNGYQWLIDAPLPLLTSAIQEALRISSSSFSMRRVCHPVDFAGFHFEIGDQIICVTRSVHLDEEIHPKATEFTTERYMAGQNKFSKGGKPVPNHSMPFGGGVSMCEGRHFAMAELKIFLGIILSSVTIELDLSSTSRPKFHTPRTGGGIMPPIGDLQVEIHKRTDI